MERIYWEAPATARTQADPIAICGSDYSQRGLVYLVQRGPAVDVAFCKNGVIDGNRVYGIRMYTVQYAPTSSAL